MVESRSRFRQADLDENRVTVNSHNLGIELTVTIPESRGRVIPYPLRSCLGKRGRNKTKTVEVFEIMNSYQTLARNIGTLNLFTFDDFTEHL